MIVAGPMRVFADPEGVAVTVCELAGNEVFGHTFGAEILFELLALLVEEVAEPLQKQHAEDVFLVFGCVHIAAQVIAGTKQETRELAEGELGHFKRN